MPEIHNEQEKHGGNSPGIPGNDRVISYNVNEDQRPGALRIRFKIRVQSGKKAAARDALMASAVKELLEWSRQHRTPS
jgi:hypothetical protein